MSQSQDTIFCGEIVSDSVEQTFALGERLGRLVQPGDVLCLAGPLGAAKTLLTKGIARGAGVVDPRQVTSPTFTLINEYQGRLPIYHVDVYRLRSARELLDLGIDEYLYGHGVCIIEWADRVAAVLPPERLDMTLTHVAPHQRRIAWMGRGERHAALAAALAARDGA